jgi:hypothetical protein
VSVVCLDFIPPCGGSRSGLVLVGMGCISWEERGKLGVKMSSKFLVVEKDVGSFGERGGGCMSWSTALVDSTGMVLILMPLLLQKGRGRQ